MNYVLHVLITLAAFLLNATCFADTSNNGPSFTDVVTVLKAERIKDAKLLYWDASAAAALGLETPPGRPGISSFDNAILQNFAFELSANADSLDAKRDLVSPRFYIEDDAHGGAGRAGYLQVMGRNNKTVWVNIKGIGHTGMGNTRGTSAGPPLDYFSSHEDGGMSLVEGITEVVNAHIADNNLKYGASRVVALIATGRSRNIKGSQEAGPLVIVVRAPIRRLDRGDVKETKTRIMESLAMANMRRVVKGDFVNHSNIGFDGTFVDFGLMGLTTGYTRVTNRYSIDYNTHFLNEHTYVYPGFENNFYIGKYLLNQMGIEEAKIDRFVSESQDNRQQLIILGKIFRGLVYINGTSKADSHNPNSMIGRNDYSKLFETFVYDVIQNLDSPGHILKLIKSGFSKLTFSLRFRSNRLLGDFVQLATDVVTGILRTNSDSIGDLQKYAEAVRKAAKYKNRDVRRFTKRALFQRAWDLSTQEGAGRRPLQSEIDGILLDAQLTTKGFATSQLTVQPGTEMTKIYIPAFADQTGHKPALFPELEARPFGDSYEFRINISDIDEFHTFKSELIRTAAGLLYVIEIPNNKYSVSEHSLRIVPVDGVRNATQTLEYKCPPLIFNERLGLEPDFKKIPSLMEGHYKTLVTVRSEDIPVWGVINAKTCKQLFAN